MRLWDLETAPLVSRLESMVESGQEPTHPHERLLLRSFTGDRPLPAAARNWSGSYLGARRAGMPEFICLLAELRQIRELAPLYHRQPESSESGEAWLRRRKSLSKDRDAVLSLVRQAVESPTDQEFALLFRALAQASIAPDQLQGFWGLYQDQASPTQVQRIERLSQLLLPAGAAPVPHTQRSNLLGPLAVEGPADFLLVPSARERRVRRLTVAGESIRQQREQLALYTTFLPHDGPYRGSADSRFIDRVQCSTDGTLLAVTCRDSTTDVACSHTGQVVLSCPGTHHRCVVRSGEAIYVGGDTGLYCQRGTQQELVVLSEEPIAGLSCTPDGHLVTLHQQGYVLFDLEHICLWAHPQRGIRLSPLGDALCLGIGGRLRVLSLPEAKLLFSFPTLEGSQVAFTLDGEALAVLHEGTVTLWSLKGKVLDRFFADGRNQPRHYETRSPRELSGYDRFFDGLSS